MAEKCFGRKHVNKEVLKDGWGLKLTEEGRSGLWLRVGRKKRG